MKKERGLLGTLFFWWAVGHLGCWGTILAVVVLAIFAAVAAVLIIRIVEVLVALGALFGAGITLRNYGLALYHNLHPERIV